MAGIKFEEKFLFPSGHVYFLMDDEWGIEIKGEDGIGGNFVTIGSWDFNEREAWLSWGSTCLACIRTLKDQFDSSKLTEDDIFEFLHSIKCLMESDVESALIAS